MHKYIDMERLESWERLNSKILFPLWWNYAATKNKKYSERPAALYCKLLNSMQKRSNLYCDTCETLRSWQMFCKYWLFQIQVETWQMFRRTSWLKVLYQPPTPLLTFDIYHSLLSTTDSDLQAKSGVLTALSSSQSAALFAADPSITQLQSANLFILFSLYILSSFRNVSPFDQCC